MAIFCHTCGTSNFRTSRLRASDLPHLLLLRIPVRCLNCDERAYTFLTHFLRLRREHRERHRRRRDAA